MPVAEAGAQRRQLEPRREGPRLLLEVAQRVLGERLERVGDPALLLGERLLERDGVEDGALRHERPVPPDAAAVDADELPVGEHVEERRAGGVDEPDARAHELERAGVREPPRRGARDVDDRPDAGLRELLGRDAVDVGVVDDRDVLGAEALDEVLRPPAEPGATADLAVHRALVRGDGAHELLAAEHALELVAALRIVQHGDPRVRRVTRDLLDAQVLVGDARDLRQVRDGQHLRPPGEPAQDVGHPVRGDAADSGVDLVEDHRLAARDGCDGEGDARELAARGRLGHGCERKPGVGADEEDHLVGARHPWLALAQLHVELALPQAEIGELVRHGRRERARRFPAGIRERACGAVEPRLRGVPVGARPLERVAGRPHVLQLGQRRGTPFEQLVEARRTMAPLRVRDPVEPLLDLRHPGGIGVERVGEASHVAPDLAQADDEVAQLAGRGLELGREALERRKRALGSSGEGAGAVPVVRLDRRHGGLGTLAELGDVPHPLAFRAERLLLARLEPLGVLDQQSELGEPLALGVCAALEVVESPCRRRRARARRPWPRRDARAGRARRRRRAGRAGGTGARAAAARTARRVRAAGRSAATRSSRATLRPHAYARERPSAVTRRATTRPGSSSGRSSRSGSSPSSSKNPSGTSSSASTYASEPAAPTEAASPFAPRRSPIACVTIVLPAPVSPVRATSPGASSRSASRIRTRFSIRSRRSTERS